MSGFVYFLRCGDFVKIGYSRNPQARIRLMDNYLPLEPIIAAIFPARRAIECKLHRHLSQHRSRGEWFHWCDDIAAITQTGLPDLSHLGPGPWRRRAHTLRLKAAQLADRAAS
jgi:hypothetical protein